MTPLIIFMAEDNAGDIILVREALRRHVRDFELFVAENGDQLIELLARMGGDVPGPNVLLLDLNLPRMEGPELFSRVRAHPLCAELPLIVVTSSNSPKDHAWTSQFNVSHYFRKPSNLDEFLALGALIRQVATSEGRNRV